MPVARTRKPKNGKKPSGRGGARPPGPPRPAVARRGGGPRRLAAALLAAALVCVLTVAALSALSPDSGGSADSGGSGASGEEGVEPLPEDHPALELARRDAGDPLALGETDAPVVMIEYVDFQDAFSGIHARDTHDQLVSEYVDAGVLRIEFRNYPIYGPESDAAARAAWAAGRQGRFWEFYEAALAEEFHQNSGRFDEDGVRELARQAGVADLDRFAADMDSEEAGEAVGRDAEEAFDLGVTSTPSFLINGQALQGARPMDEFRELIDQLSEAEQ
ncbi:DsbA family protein [Streptomyces litchfieldiae]|uniref:Thioredoxin domain-containing protein n=1 Tax=Streptomyces litchfieldiae TaxID=3075543 RepID=A0ABU2MXF5_9ACTN|nr:thioredoxin domain-containing protein [Streptomyces sp. DSM 44938]MDT0346171.1 thioredoxin domain-containing protein [Streptomyces sp. DSM 44938]